MNYVNFDNLALGSSGGSSGGLSVSFAGGGQAVQGAGGGWAPPYLSDSNGALFGDKTVSGPDTTPYVTTYTGSVTLALPGQEEYFGLLWGSVDTFNTLTFYDATGTPVGSLVGTDVTLTADGNQGASGTFYVNINSTLPFTKVVASGSVFEFDNVAYNPTIPPYPEPATYMLMFAGLGAVGLAARRRTRSEAPQASGRPRAAY